MRVSQKTFQLHLAAPILLSLRLFAARSRDPNRDVHRNFDSVDLFSADLRGLQLVVAKLFFEWNQRIVRLLLRIAV